MGFIAPKVDFIDSVKNGTKIKELVFGGRQWPYHMGYVNKNCLRLIVDTWGRTVKDGDAITAEELAEIGVSKSDLQKLNPKQNRVTLYDLGDVFTVPPSEADIGVKCPRGGIVYNPSGVHSIKLDRLLRVGEAA